MKLNSTRTYRVWKYNFDGNGDAEHSDYGTLPGTDVIKMVKGYKYDNDMGLYFSKNANFAYEVEEA